ncbi:hypothetical protein OBA27_03550, partial [Pelagibacteraceae bacterium]|nr:hypothetical protein [Pelagibacteraceae bacterium]
PIISTKTTGCSEVFMSKELLVTYNKKYFCEAIDKLIKNYQKFQKIAKKQTFFVRDKFSWQQMALKYENLFLLIKR